jgi:hypothetical protein
MNRRDQFVVPPGHEAVVARMLNPSGLADGGWTFVRATIERMAIHGFYRSAHGEVARVTLGHPSAAPTAWPRTARFAVTLRVNSQREAAAFLLRAVIAGVRAAEGEFAWQDLGDAGDSPAETRALPGESASPRPDRSDEERRARAAEDEIDLHLDHTPIVDLQIEFDHAGALAEAMALKDRFVAYQSDPSYGVSGWRGLALQALDGDASRAATTDTDRCVFEDQSRYRLTDVAARCPITMAFLERVLDFDNCRTIAFLMLTPGARIEVHVDGEGPPVMRSLNIALNMPPGCTLTIDCNPDGSDHPYTRRAPFRDGSVLLMNVAKYHQAMNDSPVPRIHVVSRGSLRVPATRVLALAEAQDGLHGPDALRAALAEKRRVLSSLHARCE